MKLNQINQISFAGKIIDSHAHFGHWGQNKTFLGADALDIFIKNPLNININGIQTKDTIEKMLVSCLDCICENNPLDETTGLEQTINLARKNPKIGVLAVCQPNITNGDPTKIKKAIENSEGKVLGLKFHPRILSKSANGSQISASHSWYRNYMQVAKEKNLPCLFHCDSDISGAQEIYTLAKSGFNNVPIVLGHTGAGDDKNFQEALNVLKSSIDKKDANLYCDISWLDWKNGLPDGNHKKIKILIEEFKKRNALDKILFGTDAPLGCFGEQLQGNLSQKEAYEKTVCGIKTMIAKEFGEESEDIIDKIFYQNAKKLFFSPKNNQTTIIKKQMPKTLKYGIIFTGIISALGFLEHLYFKRESSVKNK